MTLAERAERSEVLAVTRRHLLHYHRQINYNNCGMDLESLEYFEHKIRGLRARYDRQKRMK